MTQEVLKLALEALEGVVDDAPKVLDASIAGCRDAITAIKKALAQPDATMQPIIKDGDGVIRFKKNGLVDALYEHGVKTGLGLNELHCMNFTDEDRQQFAQLIGYSVSGYGSLSYVTDEAYETASEAANSIKE